MWVIKYRKIFYSFSIFLVVASLVSILVWGLKPGLDFSGGTLVDIQYEGIRPSQSDIVKAIGAIDPAASVRPSGEDAFIVRMRPVDQVEKAEVMKVLSLNGNATTTIRAFDSIGPVLGQEALRKAIVSVILVILGIVIFITFAFRKVSEPVSSWKYGLTAVIALIHDVIIPIGVFSVLGHFAGYEVDTLFVTALLVILGFSVHDTIVVFDRVRENLRLSQSNKPFEEVVGESINQTFTRSINTSMTTLIALLVLYFFGGSITEHFSLALIIGIAAGTYSSIFIGSPLLVTIEKWGKKKTKTL
ncbi:MAG: protein translocase subunit SecF [Candidatus Paceibacterota bacterium]|jgi:preprotein translocase subunit SecF